MVGDWMPLKEFNGFGWGRTIGKTEWFIIRFKNHNGEAYMACSLSPDMPHRFFKREGEASSFELAEDIVLVNSK